MIVEKNQIFNMMDTNGRRSDVLNALKTYLDILEELKEVYPTESWGTYPSSLYQFLFYKKAIEKSKDVFKKHDRYDKFMSDLAEDYQVFLNRDPKWIESSFQEYAKVMDEAIEKRARHYTSNLVKIGFTNASRSITEAGFSYLRGNVTRDCLEELLPIDNVNIALLRQLLKLKVFGVSENGKRPYYSPFVMALVLLLSDEPIDEHSFEAIVQGLTPYSSADIKEAVCNNTINIEGLEESVRGIDISVPVELAGKEDVDFDIFRTFFRGSKNNNSISRAYFDFYYALKKFRNNKNEEAYKDLLACLDNENASLINKAFGFGKAIFNAGSKGSRYDLEKFIEKNADHPLIFSGNYIEAFYSAYTKSKWVDGIKEYSDTTTRLLSATGLFSFKALPELSYKEILSLIFNINELRHNVFGEMTEDEFVNYEVTDACLFGKNLSLTAILGYSSDDLKAITEKIEDLLGVSTAADVKRLLNDRRSREFLAHINTKYPKKKIMELLPLFSDRSKDNQIKNEVNDAATVPTIYEYIIGIAWYYISNREFDLYSSLNLTLNADFEPVVHAGGGDGDIVIHYEDIVAMLEVTLMNKQAQKRGEWEPVLRHTLNLKAANEPKPSITFFIADELDYNTVNIWRAVAAVSLESTNTHAKVDGVIIMPFTNTEIFTFLNQGVYYKDIVNVVKSSFAKIPQITDFSWREEVISSLT